MIFHFVRYALFVLIPVMFILPGLAGANDTESYGTEKIADGVYLFRSGSQRSLFLVGETGVIVTDPLNQAAAKVYRESISRVTKLPVKYVVYSHYHWDRVSGGQIFKDEGARFVAQEQCTQRFRVNPNPAVVMPDISFADRLDVSVGDMTLEMHYFGPSHGDCLTVLLVEPANLMQVVDMVNPPRASFPVDPNVPHIRPHNLRQFFGAVDGLVAERGVQEIVASRAGTLSDGTVISATGPVIAVREQAAFWSSIFMVVDVADGQGQIGLDSFVKMEAIDLNLFKPYAGYEPKDLPLIMRRFVGYLAMGR
jgi:glyoxylase-like metal-dependent hydrolase (beta-lactamase superfamily II)